MSKATVCIYRYKDNRTAEKRIEKDREKRNDLEGTREGVGFQLSTREILIRLVLCERNGLRVLTVCSRKIPVKSEKRWSCIS